MIEQNNEWREVKRDVNRVLGLTVKVWLILLVLAALVGAGIWGITVATSGVKGQGDGIIKKNSSDNWIKQQAKFEELNAEYESTLFRIKQFKVASDAAPEDAIAKTNLQGQISHCSDVVAEYNAASRSFLSEDWKSIDLPASLDVSTCTPKN